EEEPLEVQPVRSRRPQALEGLRAGLRDHARPLLDHMGALVRHSRRPQMGAQRRHRRNRAENAGGLGPALSQAGLGSKELRRRLRPSMIPEKAGSRFWKWILLKLEPELRPRTPHRQWRRGQKSIRAAAAAAPGSSGCSETARAPAAPP